MSDLNQIHTALERLSNEEGQRIVFRNDPDPIAWGLCSFVFEERYFEDRHR
jgi:hypothetical protein